MCLQIMPSEGDSGTVLMRVLCGGHKRKRLRLPRVNRASFIEEFRYQLDLNEGWDWGAAQVRVDI